MQIWKFAVLMAVAVAFCVPLSAQTSIVYVDADAQGLNDGSSWADAYTDLNFALGQEGAATYWVAEGRYVPGTIRQHSFIVPGGSEIYGGFDGTETSLAERDPAANETTLSGDLAGDDQYFLGNIIENSFQIVRCLPSTATTVLDGLSIRGGYGFGSSQNRGAGLEALSCHVRLENCLFEFHVARTGAAIYASTLANIELSNCRLRYNEVRYGMGGAMALETVATLTATNCLFEGNRATGGTNLGAGGALSVNYNSDATIKSTTFLENVSVFGCCSGFDPCEGGAIRSRGELTLTECRFIKNEAHNGGALSLGGTSNLENCEFIRNQATLELGFGGEAGAVKVIPFSSVNIRCTTFYNNAAFMRHGGLHVESPSTVGVDTSIFWANWDTLGVGAEAQISGTNAAYSCIENLFIPSPGFTAALPSDFPGSFDFDPMFMDPNGPDNISGNEDDDLRIASFSPCVDAGAVGVDAGGLDTAGSPRLLDGDLNGGPRLDMGAHEFTHARLSVTSTEMPGGTNFTATIEADSAIPLVSFVGIYRDEVMIPPYGGIWFDTTRTFLMDFVGYGPSISMSYFAPASLPPFLLTFQGLALGGAGVGNFSNPVLIQLD